MPLNTTEKQFESDIAATLLSPAGGYTRNGDCYDPKLGLFVDTLIRFVQKTQPNEWAFFEKQNPVNPVRKFCTAFNNACDADGLLSVLRYGFKHRGRRFRVCYFQPESALNQKDAQRYAQNEITCNRQWFYSDTTHNSVDMVLAVNGIPVFAFELKNQFTGQTVENAKQQWMHDRDPREVCFQFNKRILGYFCVDLTEVWMATRLAGKDTRFLPFNQGSNGAGRDGGAGNPPNPNGYLTAYLWEEVFQKDSMMDILQKFMSLQDGKTLIFPRYHQLDVVRKLVADVRQKGAGQHYLIQHSAGSGKSNSIAWLAHQLIGLERDGRPMIDSVIVVTDRRILDKQIRDTIKQFMQVKNTVVWAQHSGDLKKAIQDGKRIIVTTVEKFPYISQEIGQEHINHTFAIIIDEAHSGQSGRNAANMNLALSGLASDSELDNEDKINAMVEGRKLVKTASYFAFTATPKNKTEEVFGTPYEEDGQIKHRPFHVYTMKQAIQEGFILDVLKNYVTIDSWYKIAKKVEDDPMFDKKRAQKKLRSFVEGNPDVIAKKAAMMVDHFHEQIIARKKLGGQSRAMVVTASIPRCIETYYAITKCLADRHSPYKAIIAFSGECSYHGQEPPLTSAAMNGFPDAKIPQEFKKAPYRLLVVADMFQTGFDEPLLQTMYVDKPLSDIAAVQSLSRLNRAAPGKDEVYVLDFANKAETIEKAFSRFYRTTILSGETDPNKLYDLISLMEDYQVYDHSDVEKVVDLFLSGGERDRLDPLLDSCVVLYDQLETEDQIQFKSAAKAFVRTYGFLGSILPYGNAAWEKLSIFLNLLIPKLPSPQTDDLSEGILAAVDLDSYRNEAREAVAIRLEDEDAEIAPVPTGKVGHIVEPEMDPLSHIISEFNDMFGNIQWNDADNVQRQLLQIPAMVSHDEKYRNAMKNSDEQEARTESERALQQVIFSIMADNMELFKQFQDNPSFKKWLTDMVFNLTYNKEGKSYEVPGNCQYSIPEQKGGMVAERKPDAGEKNG
ncbi:type I restriction endonuclease subunit R [uncultured Megasphaera sp.]|uniref:type I restriction endonuclease subunit R n=1 Tax=uncultured Megasphaera sp. TaxID=165188 RepID=UPI00266BF762|nr:DEAD/DEAH box helicase family protein [uncultured Megasphaera sp.]